MRGRKLYLAVLAVSLLVGAGAFFFGCSWFDDDEVAAPPPPQLTGFALTPATMEDAAAISAGGVQFFNQIGVVFLGIAGNFLPPVSAPAGPSPLLPIPIPGGSGLCLPGATLANVTWNDNANNTIPSAGDSITVALQNCALVADGGQSVLSGTPNPAITFTATTVTTAGIIGTFAFNLTSASASAPTDTTVISGLMPASFSALGFPAATVTLGQVNGTAANTQITIVDSAGSLAFGCFDVSLTFPDATNPFNFDTSVRGVAKIDDLAIMQLGDYAVESDPSPLSFVGGIPVSGKLKLLSFDSRASVPGLSSCYGTVTGTTSELVTALGESAIRLDQFNNITWSGTPDNTITTTWGALTGL
jgi:hypothetical protein